MPVFDFLEDLDNVKRAVERTRADDSAAATQAQGTTNPLWEARPPAPRLDAVAELCSRVTFRWLLTGLYYRRRREFIQAEFCFDELMRQVPEFRDDLNAVYHLGDTLKELGKPAEDASGEDGPLMLCKPALGASLYGRLLRLELTMP